MSHSSFLFMLTFPPALWVESLCTCTQKCRTDNIRKQVDKTALPQSLIPSPVLEFWCVFDNVINAIFHAGDYFVHFIFCCSWYSLKWPRQFSTASRCWIKLLISDVKFKCFNISLAVTTTFVSVHEEVWWVQAELSISMLQQENRMSVQGREKMLDLPGRLEAVISQTGDD